ncbi:hypothetical protein EKE94_02125 [Mesobaculum littorinae]|uniref:Uncharacterized protein n=2 Tax=Mesobaculum littorinae TaxID=2486419 RepID=A0A438AL01_9RHOB|nr:hypothetical protein EKE94_02125 [Mesobaculum littorinae]
MDEVREIQVDDEVEREDDIRLLEMILQQTGLALPGAVAFCRHEAQGYYAVVVEDRDISFLHLMNGEEGWFASEVPRPNFWAVQPNRHAQEGETGMVQ